MKVLISDNLSEAGIDRFRKTDGLKVDVNVGLKPEDLISIIGDYDALVIRSATKVTEELLEAAKNLKVVGRAGIGLDNVDISAATRRGIVVMNTPTGNVVTTAEHTIAMLMSLSRNIPQGTYSLKAGRWDKKRLQGAEIFGKTLGVIGFGKIGSIVADRARGLKMNVVVSDPYITPEEIEKKGFKSVSLEELYRISDFITVHVPKLKNTTGLIGRDAFEEMKNGVRVLNCARGGIVNEADLLEALKSGKVAGAALDVFETEPPGENELLKMENVICTPHLGAATQEAQINVAVQIADQIIAYLKEGTIMNAVNVPSVTGTLLERLKPFLYLAERMGMLQAQISCGPLKEVIIEYVGDFKGLELAPVTTAALKGMLSRMIKDDVNFVNAHVMAKERGVKVTESSRAESDNFNNLIVLEVITTDMRNRVSGTIFGKMDPRVVEVNDFRLELVPEGHLALIHNQDKPGAIGSIGTMLGKYNVNISRMQVGQDLEGENNIIFLRTDTPIPDEAVEKIRALPLIETVTPLEFDS